LPRSTLNARYPRLKILLGFPRHRSNWPLSLAQFISGVLLRANFFVPLASLPTQIEDSYRIRCFLYKDSASKAELKSRLTQTGNFGAGPNLPRTSFTMTCRYAIGGYESRLAASLTYLRSQHNMTVLWRTPTHYSGRPSPTTALSRSWAGVGWVSCTRPRTSILAVLSR